MRNALLIITALLTQACATVSANGGTTTRVSTLANGMIVTVVNRCTDKGNFRDGHSSEVRDSVPLGSLRVYQAKAGWDENFVKVIFEGHNDDGNFGTATQTIPLTTRGKVVWIIGQPSDLDRREYADAYVIQSEAIENGRDVCRHK